MSSKCESRYSWQTLTINTETFLGVQKYSSGIVVCLPGASLDILDKPGLSILLLTLFYVGGLLGPCLDIPDKPRTINTQPFFGGVKKK